MVESLVGNLVEWKVVEWAEKKAEKKVVYLAASSVVRWVVWKVASLVAELADSLVDDWVEK